MSAPCNCGPQPVAYRCKNCTLTYHVKGTNYPPIPCEGCGFGLLELHNKVRIQPTWVWQYLGPVERRGVQNYTWVKP